MAQYTNKFVDEKYSSLLEENLFENSVLIPGVTYSTNWQGDAASGAVKIYKLTSGTVTAGTPGRDFTNVDGANTLLTLNLDKNFQKSYKIFGVQAAAVDHDMGSGYLQLAVKEVSQGWQASALGVLEAAATDMADITAITKSNVYGYMVDARKVLVDAGAMADIAMVSTAVYASLVKSPEFTHASSLGDSVIATGALGKVAGMLVFESQSLAAATDFIVYDHMTFAIATNLEAMRVIDSEHFTGSLAQVEINSGFLVTNADRTLIKKNV